MLKCSGLPLGLWYGLPSAGRGTGRKEPGFRIGGVLCGYWGFRGLESDCERRTSPERRESEVEGSREGGGGGRGRAV